MTLDIQQHTLQPHPKGYAFTYFAFFITSGATLVAWISFILSIDWFQAEYPDHAVGFVFPMFNMIPLLVVTTIMLKYSEQIDINIRLFVSFVVLFLAVCCVPLIQLLPLPTSVVFGLTLAALVGCSSSGAVIQASIYGIANSFGEDFVQAMESGKGAIGVFLVILRFLTKYYFDTPEEPSDTGLFLFFTVAAFIILLAMICFYLIHSNAYAQPKFQEYYAAQEQLPTTECTPLLAGETPQAWRVLKHIWSPLLVVFLTFGVCLSCFPGLTTRIESTTFDLKDWFPVVLIASYNFGDLCGKVLPAFIPYLPQKWIYYGLLVQLSFVPVFIWDVIHPFADYSTITLVTLLGTCTGYLGTSCLMIIPACCSPEEHSLAGILGSLGLISGLVFGSFVGFILDLTML